MLKSTQQYQPTTKLSMLYLGLPLRLSEAIRLFGGNEDDDFGHHNDIEDMRDFVDHTMCLKEMKMEFHTTDKCDRVIIGYEIKMDAERADSFITQLDELRADFKREIAPLYENYPDVELQLTYKSYIVVHRPEPYVIQRDHPDPTIPVYSRINGW